MSRRQQLVYLWVFTCKRRRRRLLITSIERKQEQEARSLLHIQNSIDEKKKHLNEMSEPSKYLPQHREQRDLFPAGSLAKNEHRAHRTNSPRRTKLSSTSSHSNHPLVCMLPLLLLLLQFTMTLVLLFADLIEASSELAPRITIQPNDLIAIEGESTELNCDAEGEPEPTIEWYHNGQLIKASTHSRTTMGGSIQFLDIRPASTATLNGKPSDIGIYYCLARNSLGQAKSRNASLQVACK